MSQRPEIQLASIVGRMIRTETRVGFVDCDPYGHMASSRYLEMAVNHRMSAVTEQLGYDTLKTARDVKLAFINKEVHLDFKASAQFDEPLVVESWIEGFKRFRMTVKVRISKAGTGDVCCLVTIKSVSLDPESLLPVNIPAAYVPVGDVDIESLPFAPGHQPG